MPPAVLILGHSLCKDHFTVLHIPPGIFLIYISFDHIGPVKGHFSVFDIPPAVLILRESIVCKVHFAVLYIPPAVLVFHHAHIVLLDIAVLQIPPGTLVFIQAGIVLACDLGQVGIVSHGNRQSGNCIPRLIISDNLGRAFAYCGNDPRLLAEGHRRPFYFVTNPFPAIGWVRHWDQHLFVLYIQRQAGQGISLLVTPGDAGSLCFAG